MRVATRSGKNHMDDLSDAINNQLGHLGPFGVSLLKGTYLEVAYRTQNDRAFESIPDLLTANPSLAEKTWSFAVGRQDLAQIKHLLESTSLSFCLFADPEIFPLYDDLVKKYRESNRLTVIPHKGSHPLIRDGAPQRILDVRSFTEDIEGLKPEERSRLLVCVRTDMDLQDVESILKLNDVSVALIRLVNGTSAPLQSSDELGDLIRQAQKLATNA